MGKIKGLLSRFQNILLALLIISWQVVFAGAPLFQPSAASAATTNYITASNHEGQLNPGGTYTNGDIKTYREGDSINFRFTLTATHSGSGQMQVLFSNYDGVCNFFEQSFVLGTIENTSGILPTVTKNANPVAITSGPNSGDWAQTLDVNFSGVGIARVNYTLKLTLEAGQCNGSSQHSRLDNFTGDFKNTGAQNVPVPAKDVLILPSITITKTVATGSATPSEFSFDVSPAINGTSHYTIASGNSIFIDNIPTDGTYTITESGPSGYTFTSGSGTNCSAVQSSLNTASGQMSASVAAGTTPSSATCNFTNAILPSTLTVVKNVINNNGGTATADNFAVKVNDVQLTGGQLSNNNLTDTYSYGNPVSGTPYTVSEDSPTTSGYAQSSLVCKDNSTQAAVSNPVTLNPGQKVTCTITNDDIAPSLTLNKIVSNTHGGTAVESNWTLTATGPTTLSGPGAAGNTDVVSGATFSAGIYTLSESTGPSGYSPSAWTCTNNVTVTNNQITLANGQTTVCSITNSDLAPSITVTKIVNNPYGTPLSVSSFPLFVDSTSVISGQTYTSFNAGNHLISETQQTGLYTLTNVSGDCSQDQNTLIISILLSLGTGSTCTLTNTAVQPKLTVIKHVINDNGGNKTASDFTMTVSGNSATITNFPGSEAGTTVGLNEGSYSVDETSHTGYTKTLGADCSGSISIGQTKTCTITNDDIAPTLTLVKNVSGGDATVSDWTLSATPSDNQYSTLSGAGGFSNQTAQANLEYTLSESSSTTGYTAGLWSCNGGTLNGNVLTLHLDSNVTCSITNTRDTGHIEVVKDLNPSNDSGLFDLHISGPTSYNRYDVGDGGTTNNRSVLTGLYVVSETAGTGTNTNLGNYESSYSCTNGLSGNGTITPIFTVTKDESVKCTFTNERHATITVIKNVDDGFGNVTQDVNTWTWGYDGESYDDHLSTGSTNTQEVVAGDYSIWENAQDNYHFTSVSCSNDAGAVEVDNSASFDTSLAAGENLTCTFLNTRDTGTITVHKILYPATDSGLFNLQINGTIYATDVGDGGTTGKVKVVTGDGYYIGETAGTNTSLDSYQTWYWCSNERTNGSGTTSGTFSVGSDQNINCYFENVRLGTLTGMKFDDLNGNGKKDQGEPGLKDWTIQLYECQQEVFTLNIDSVDQVDGCVPTLLETTTTDADGNYTFNNLPSGDYKVCEVQQVGWTQTAPDNTGCQEFNINLDIEEGQPGQVVTKDFGNFQNGSISGFKFSDPNGNGKWDNGEPKLSGWTITLSKSDDNGGWTQLDSAVTDANGSYSFTDLPPADYQVCEVPQTGWIRISPKDSNCQVVSINQSGQAATALFANQKKVKPVVLALVNTGQNIMVSLYAGIALLSVLGAVTWAAKKQ